MTDNNDGPMSEPIYSALTKNCPPEGQTGCYIMVNFTCSAGEAQYNGYYSNVVYGNCTNCDCSGLPQQGTPEVDAICSAVVPAPTEQELIAMGAELCPGNDAGTYVSHGPVIWLSGG